MIRKYVVLVLAMVILTFFWLTRLENSTVLATQADEGVHVTVAELVSESDRKIYDDLFENRTPGAEWLLSGWFRLTGATVFMARFMSISLLVMTVALLLALSRYASRSAGVSTNIAGVAGLGAACLYALDPLGLFWSRFTMLEHFATAAATATIFAASVALRRQSQVTWFLSGLLAALTVVFKQTEVVLLAAFVAFFGLRVIATGARRTYRPAYAWTAGLLLIGGLFFAILAIQGTLGSFIQFTTSAGQIAPLENVGLKLSIFKAWFLRTPAMWLSVPALLFAIWLKRASMQLILLWFAAECAFLFLPPQLDLSPGGFSHYALPTIAAAAVLSASGAALMWQWLDRRRSIRHAGALFVVAAAILLVPSWYADFATNLSSASYPDATLGQEMEIGRAAALLTGPDRPILVLANATFYHRAQRTPAARFFHWPEYLSNSDLAPLAVGSVTYALESAETGAVLASRLHLEERLPQQVLTPLWRQWIPAALFPYPYQRDVILFLPRVTPPEDDDVLATFGDRFRLLSVDPIWLDKQNLLVALWWRSDSAPAESYTVFVHVLGDQQGVLAQDDALPVVGFRPTTTWQEGEAVLDYHWIKVPDGSAPTGLQLNVGLYESATGERLQRESEGAPRDAFRRPLKPVQ